MRSGRDHRRVAQLAGGDRHSDYRTRLPEILRDALIAVVLLPVGVFPAAAQAPAEPGGRAALVPAQSSASPPNALGMRGPQLTVPNVILAEPASEMRLVIELEPADAAPRGSFVRIRGLPPTAALSEGHAIAPGAWAVPTAALKNLRIIVPAGTAGRSEISVSLVTLDGAIISEAKGSLVVAAARLIAPKDAPPAVSAAKEPPTSRSFAPFEQAPAAPAQQAPPAPPKQEQQAARPPVTPNEPAATPPPPAVVPPPIAPAAPKAAPPAPSAAPKSPEPAPPVPAKAPDPVPPGKEISAAARQKAEGLMSRGRAMLSEGNIAAARLFFERSADEGFADGALAMGTTFDPAELQRMRALGTQPDPAAARRWYERAKSLGSRDAEAKLQALSAR